MARMRAGTRAPNLALESPDKPAVGAHPDRQTVATIDRLVLNLDCCRFIQLIANQSGPVLSKQHTELTGFT